MLSKAMIDRMLEMPDEKLLMMLKIVMSGAGLETAGKGLNRIDEKSLRKLRCVLAEVTDSDLERVSRLTEVYKNG